MNGVLEVFVIGLLAGGLGTMLGGLITVACGRISRGFLSVIMGFAGGVMISIVCFDLIPEALEIAPIAYGLIGLVGGAIIISVIDLYIPHSHEVVADKKSRYLRAGILLAIGLTMHSFPEGLAVGASFAVGMSLGFKLTIIMSLQKIPEGMAITAPLLLGGVTKGRTIIGTFLVGLPMGIGALVGVIVGGISAYTLAVALGFAGGAMLYITCDSLIPDAHACSHGHSATFGIVAGIIVGIVISSTIMF
ncbi:MAG: ZIP family metal transporter [Clostridia bacterium]|nr:ZIP family metal transporter [Clostridia bacterium]